MKINNNIQEDYCSYELSKLFKEKNFKNETYCYYLNSDEEFKPELKVTNRWRNWNTEDDSFSTPTLSLAQKWVYENFNLSICVHNKWTNGFKYIIENGYYKDWVKGYPDNNFISLDEEIESEEYFNTPQEALEAGLMLVLKELI